jgi:mannose-6-phosphate isomerase-like protein (cupin superfamily)
MNTKDYIESGIIQDYCLGVLSDEEKKDVEQQARLYHEIRQEIDLCQDALEKDSLVFSKPVAPGLKSKILAVLDNLVTEEKAEQDNLPLLNRFSNYKNWLHMVRPMLPGELTKGIFSKVLREDDAVFQALLWVKDYYPDEVHDDLNESFMILEGECECHIENEIIKLGTGDFFDVPLHKHHDVKVTRGPVLAIVQRLKVA